MARTGKGCSFQDSPHFLYSSGALLSFKVIQVPPFFTRTHPPILMGQGSQGILDFEMQANELGRSQDLLSAPKWKCPARKWLG